MNLAIAFSNQGFALAEERQYDDPAVAICETLIRAEVPAGAEYERVDARVEGASAIVAYRVSILNTRPAERERECQFVANESGSFKLRGHEPIRRECNAEIAALKATQNWRAPASFQEAEKARNDLKNCDDQMKRDFQIMARELADRDLPLALTGIYPIEPSSTELRGE